jgi:hypothetical protein
MHIIIPLITLAIGLAGGWYLHAKYGVKAGQIETKIEAAVKP